MIVCGCVMSISVIAFVGVVNGQWRSMTAFFEMCSYLLGFIVHGKVMVILILLLSRVVDRS